MAWDFETDPEFQVKLDWAADFVRDRVEPLEHVFGHPFDRSDHAAMRVVRGLQYEVRAQGLWACHLTPDLGGQGYGQVKLALLNEILGRSTWAPSVFGCQAPDSGNSEVLAKYGSEEQKQKWLYPLLAGDISSCYSMSEPAGGSDPTTFTARAVRDGDDWVINGEKWFSSYARYADILIVLVVTDPDVSPYRGMSMFVVPTQTPGVTIVRNVGTGTETPAESTHGYVRYTDARVPAGNLIGDAGAGFEIAQTRLGGGRIHHAMRTVALLHKAFDMMCERAVSRTTRHGPLASLEMVQERIADSWIDIEQFRLLVLRTAWLIDKHDDYGKVRKDIAAVKAAMPDVLFNVVRRAMQLHGSLGVSNEMPFTSMMIEAGLMGIADGPTEVHKVTLARQLTAAYTPVPGLWPTEHLPAKAAAARELYAEAIEDAAAAAY
jgi:acyl-CoA dehydrogenase